MSREEAHRPEHFGLHWPGKYEARRLIQPPSTGSLLPCPEESLDFETTENAIIEGDNLDVLKLLQLSHPGRIKVIYIDPPYNTGNAFAYVDNYTQSLQAYLQGPRRADEDPHTVAGTSEMPEVEPHADGRFHARWLNMIYPRLHLARNLLRDDGSIFVSIDDHEVSRLRDLLDEIFGGRNFLAQITVVSNPRGRQAELIAATHEYLLVYAKNRDVCELRGQALEGERQREYRHQTADGRRYRLRGLRHRGHASRRVDRPRMFFPLFVDPDSRQVSLQRSDVFSVEVLPRKSTGEDSRWEWNTETVARRIDFLEGVFVSTRGEWDVYQREFLLDDAGRSRRLKWTSVWDEKAINYGSAKIELKQLLGECLLQYPKPTYLLRKILDGTTSGDDLVLDFFAGSGTTAQAVLELNRLDGGRRRFLLVQSPEPTGRLDYPTIADIARERVRRVARRLEDDPAGGTDPAGEQKEDLGFRAFRLTGASEASPSQRSRDSS